jgi:metal-responsive CopG/Arc/MetJ family transcriptional regulator
MKTAISLPDDLFESADELAKRLGVSRSELYATAVAEFLAKHHHAKVTERLDQVYGQQSSRLERPLRRAQTRSLRATEW